MSVDERLAHVPSSLAFGGHHQVLALLWRLVRDTDIAHALETSGAAIPGAEAPGDAAAAAAAAVDGTDPAWGRESLDPSVDDQSLGAVGHARGVTPALAQAEAAPRLAAGIDTGWRWPSGGDSGGWGLGEAAAAAAAGSTKHAAREREEEGDDGTMEEEVEY